MFSLSCTRFEAATASRYGDWKAPLLRGLLRGAQNHRADPQREVGGRQTIHNPSSKLRENIGKHVEINKQIGSNKIVFKNNSVHIGTYKKYISNIYLKIKLEDFEQFATIEVFKIVNKDNPENGSLIDKFSNYIGHYSFWIDHTNFISSEYKNKEHQILNPCNYVPLIEYNLETPSMYHNLTNRIYRKYKYNSTLDTLTLTHNITDI